MEEVPGIPGAIPPLAPYPSPAVRSTLQAAEWEACLDSWLLSLEYRLRLPDQYFQKFKFSQSASGTVFLRSFLISLSSETGAGSPGNQKERLLLKRSYLLLRRLVLVTEVPFGYEGAELLELLQYASQVYFAVSDWKSTLENLWKRNGSQLSSSIDLWRKRQSIKLEQDLDSIALLESFRSFSSYLRLSPASGLVLMTGSDYLETLMEAYARAQPPTSDSSALQKAITEHTFYNLRSLMSDASQHVPMLLDHLYHLKSESERSTKTNPGRGNLCSSLICTTSFLRHLSADGTVVRSKRGQDLVDSLITYRQQTSHLHSTVASKRRKSSKGKGKASANEEMHIYQASQISQVHDLFPDLSDHYILRLLEHFNADIEAVLAGLLEPESLPEHLRSPGTVQQGPKNTYGPSHDLAPSLTPLPLPERKNVYDGDDFDSLRISAARLHKGRKEIKSNDFEDSNEHSRSKAAIMAALAAFDSDDDERDDTYDVADVGGTVDSTVDTDTRPQNNTYAAQSPHEESLFRAWKSNEEVFARDSKTRVSNTRQDLKRETGMSDEQLEGWAIMLKKDSKLQERLEKKYSSARTFGGGQPALAASRWQGDTPENIEGETGVDRRRMGQAQIRGNRTWGRGRGGSTAGPAGDSSTQAARKRKEQGKGRGGASHNRREGRARKMGRGMSSSVAP